MAEVTISVHADASEVSVDVALPVRDETNRVEGVAELVDRLVRSAGSHAVAGSRATVGELVDARCDALSERIAGLSDWLHKVEKDLDSRVDYALRQLQALDAPQGDDLEGIERGRAVKQSVSEWLAGDHRSAGGSWITTGALSRSIGWPEATLESDLHEMAAAGELEHQSRGKLDLWRLPQEQVVEVQVHVGGEVDPEEMGRRLGRAIAQRGGSCV